MYRDTFSRERVACKDLERRHKKVVYKKGEACGFRKIGELFPKLKHFVEVSFSQSDEVCSNCYKRLKVLATETPQDRRTEFEDHDPHFLPQEERLHELNKSLSTFKHVTSTVSPLKRPQVIQPQKRSAYVKRKLEQISGASCEMKSQIASLYDISSVQFPNVSTTQCENCISWEKNTSVAFAKAEDNKNREDKIKLLTIFPQTYTKEKILHLVPHTTSYQINKSRKLRSAKGIWPECDAYCGHPLSQEHVAFAVSYYLDDDKDCSRQSPNNKDVVTITIDEIKIQKVKSFMTRSIKEAYGVMKENHPEIKMGISKFYSLRPKWVKIQPSHQVCACIYCSNLQLICTALKNLTQSPIGKTDLFKLCLCENPREECWLQQCGSCPGKEGLTVQTLDLTDDDVTYVIWEKDNLVKKEVSVEVFLYEVQTWIIKGIFHNYVRDIQRDAVEKEKIEAKKLDSDTLVLHFDFAENWSKILPSEIQSFHWHNTQVSIFTCVAYLGHGVHSYAVVSDDTTHDTAHAMLATQKIEMDLIEHDIKWKKNTKISDGAASHFKNRYQCFEFGKTSEIHKCNKWLFTATGHGKGPCDGVGGLVKHYATKHNLQNLTPYDLIFDSRSFVSQVKKYLKNISLIHLYKSEIEKFRNEKKEQWEKIKPVVGIQRCHIWRKTTTGTALALSANHTKQLVIIDELSHKIRNYTADDFSVDDFVACVYDDDWWVAKVINLSFEHRDIEVTFMHPHGPASAFKWPVREDRCKVPMKNILLKLPAPPHPINISGRLQSYDAKTVSKIEIAFSNLI